MDKKIVVTFDKPWDCSPFEESFLIEEDLGEDENGNHVYKLKETKQEENGEHE